MDLKTPKKTLIKSENSFPVVGIGASAGGLDAFKQLLKAIPESSGMAYVLVQHLDPNHQSMLPELLQKVTSIPVMEVTDDIKVAPDHIYILPSNKIMIANDGVLELRPRPEKGINERNMPIDLFFRSLAEVHQSHSIGVVLSGTATDGTLGLTAIKDQGGITFAQDEESAAYSGMPQSAVQAGVVDFILSPGDIPKKLLEVAHIINGNGAEISGQKEEEAIYKQIISLLQVRKGTDFTYYKQTTIHRRILRRIDITKTGKPSVYLNYLKREKQELDELYMDLLIPVTEFFRDPKIFDKLHNKIIPTIIANKTSSGTVRIWVAGCSTGQEAYSLAIAFHEIFNGSVSSSSHPQKVQVFATDLSGPAIEKARSGMYSQSEVKGLTTERLEIYFTKKKDGYQINQSIRDSCVFAVHDFLKDPPFSKMDLISCRNVLIYLGSYLQKRALTTFHYALDPKGILWLGKSETTSGVPSHFVALDKKDKLFSRKEVAGHFIPTTSRRNGPYFTDPYGIGKNGNLATDYQKTADDILLSRFTPAGVVINEAMDIVHFRGGTGRYLEPVPGKASLNLFRMAKQGLAFELRNILHKAKKENDAVVKENIPIQINGDHIHIISIEAIPLPNIVEPHYLVLFHEQGPQEDAISVTDKKWSKEAGIGESTKMIEKDLQIQQLQDELAQTREDMCSIIESQEAANEELQSANEELMSGSEELQSLNEEMETSKEELHSTNEELMTVHQETIGLNERLSIALDYAEGIVDTIHEPLLVLDGNLRIKSANKTFYKTFEVNEKDTEGKLIFKLGNKQWDIPALRTLLEDILPERSTIENFEVAWNFPNIGKHTMLLNAREIKRDNEDEKLILLAIEDISERTNLREKEKELFGRYENLLLQAPVAIMVLKGSNYVVELANNAYLEMVEKDTDFIGRPFFEALPERKTQGIRELMDGVVRSGTPYHGNEVEVTMLRKEKSEKGFYNFAYHPTQDADGTVTGIIVVVTEVTEQVIARRLVEESESHFRQLAERMPAKISNADIAGNVTYFNKEWLEFTGLEFEELKELGYHKIMHPEEMQEFGERLQKALETKTDMEMEMRFLNKDGDYIWHLNIASPITDENGDFKMWIGVTTDISEQINTRKSNLETYKKQSDILEELVAQRTFELKGANDELLEMNRELKRLNKELVSFTFAASHDLQEPLRKIQIFVGRILEDEESEGLSDKGKGYFERILAVSNLMRKLIEDLLDFSRLALIDRKFITTDIDKLTANVITELETTIDEKKAIIEFNGLGALQVIPFQFQQLIFNLVSNALKFSRPDIPPYITIKSKIAKGKEFKSKKLVPNKKYYRIRVGDNGIGLRPEYGDQIFELFKRLHGKDEYPGTGIGLTIVKRIVENHNGSITVESEPGLGARFDIYIPVVQETP
ncbi:histidine kinase [Arenibacter sp. H213]|uniref:histidine kinase n=1 Tax=Arenibacter antarcticus TaxID=2040469 RepID=A0ABW5VF08_9FLAO|nr:chemotaxis protein CheB [Arenibacter sp. H213]MCM4168080.1 histidine kinase [Arenibacter sp. H213]